MSGGKGAAVSSPDKHPKVREANDRLAELEHIISTRERELAQLREARELQAARLQSLGAKYGEDR